MQTPSLPEGKLAVFLPGMGAVATTFIAGVLLARRGLGAPVGSLTQLGSIRVEDRSERIGAFVPLASLDDLEFAGWDLFPDSAFAAAEPAEGLSDKHPRAHREGVEAVPPKGAALLPGGPKAGGNPGKEATSKGQVVEQLGEDIRRT